MAGQVVVLGQDGLADVQRHRFAMIMIMVGLVNMVVVVIMRMRGIVVMRVHRMRIVVLVEHADVVHVAATAGQAHVSATTSTDRTRSSRPARTPTSVPQKAVARHVAPVDGAYSRRPERRW